MTIALAGCFSKDQTVSGSCYDLVVYETCAIQLKADHSLERTTFMYGLNCNIMLIFLLFGLEFRCTKSIRVVVVGPAV